MPETDEAASVPNAEGQHLGSSGPTEEPDGILVNFEDAIDALNGFTTDDWLTLKEVLRRHCRTPVVDSDWENLLKDLRHSFEPRFDNPSRSIPLLLLLESDLDSLLEPLEPAAFEHLPRLTDAASIEIARLRSMFGTRLKHILELPVRGSRDWVRIHSDEFQVLSSNGAPPGSIRCRIAIELRDGSLLRFESPPSSVVNLCAVLIARLPAWDHTVAADASEESWDRLDEAVREYLELRQ